MRHSWRGYDLLVDFDIELVAGVFGFPIAAVEVEAGFPG
jgi:hypothetical protein